MKDPCERENDQIASADGRVSYTVFLDESGSKQKAQTPPQDVDDVGVAVHPDIEVTFCCFSEADKAVYDSLVRP